MQGSRTVPGLLAYDFQTLQTCRFFGSGGNLLIGLTAVQELFLDFAIAAAHNPGFAHWTISLPVKTKPFSGQVSLRCHRIIE